VGSHVQSRSHYFGDRSPRGDADTVLGRPVFFANTTDTSAIDVTKKPHQRRTVNGARKYLPLLSQTTRFSVYRELLEVLGAAGIRNVLSARISGSSKPGQ
jgi:hypothetical protein